MEGECEHKRHGKAGTAMMANWNDTNTVRRGAGSLTREQGELSGGAPVSLDHPVNLEKANAGS